MTPLFLPEVDPHAFFEKQASIAKMPDDDTKWPAHVLSNLHQQLPFLSQYEVDLSLQRVEPEAGFAFGHALLMAKNDPAAATESKNPQNMIKIPVIIADRQLQPFHTFELGGNVYPLTSERVEAALLNPAVFEGPARQPHRQKSLIDQMYPPYQQRQGFGRTVGAGTSSMGVTKLSSAPIDLSTDIMNVDPGTLKRIAELRQAEKQDRIEQEKGTASRILSQGANMAIPVAAGTALSAALGSMDGNSAGRLAGALNAAKRGLGVSSTVSAATIAGREAALRKRQRDRKRLGLPRVGTREEVPIEYAPKTAAVEDAPNYGPTAGDSRCETCSYYRATNDGVGYCERFSFEAEPESVCDDFVAAGRMKSASAPRSVFSRLFRNPGVKSAVRSSIGGLSSMASNPTARRIGISAAAGGLSGAVVAGFGTGEEKAMEALKGAAIGVAVGGLLGGMGPSARRAFSATEKKFVDEYTEIIRLNNELSSLFMQMKLAAGQARTKHGDRLIFNMRREFNKFYKERDKALSKYPGDTAAKKLTSLKKMIDDLKKKQQVSKSETYGVPALSAAIGAGLGFGTSHSSKEQEKYRRSKK